MRESSIAWGNANVGLLGKPLLPLYGRQTRRVHSPRHRFFLLQHILCGCMWSIGPTHGPSLCGLLATWC